jgi:hypothetical protein
VRAARAIAMVIRGHVAKRGRQQGNGNDNKDCGRVDCICNKEGNGNGNEGGGQATGTAMKRAIATATAVVGGKEGKGNNGKIVGVGYKGGWRAKQ